ncbi:variably expressed lipoprotein and hemagglutinin (VlhA) family protein [Mycoplasmoides gallisepticum WI01_2001.043-13-2P]|uniref:Variably expressed lipoprotein and hemagglutinin (VlhA) family protein n=1 Tax=Mycoplasmoides gallisepticum WI01_2001.043-13-2P TaxID=1159201 RepID=J3TRQ7_MYCGL|nr:variably expressed lipoprotein and hemagglutinin (VlhA) family protein [Mycoplasmoides gallisepticum WI01_2001.043-13-2P]
MMLAAASCTSATTPTPNPEPKPTPNPEPKPTPMPNPGGGGDINNPPSGGMNGGDTNPGNDGGMDNAAQQLAAARTALTNLLSSKNANVQMYSDYAKIKNDLTAAYISAETASQNQAATLEQVKSATSTLQTAINTAVNEKKVFDENNSELVTAYTNLKTTLEGENTTLDAFNDSANYGGIKTHLMSLYNQAKTITTSTLLNDAGQSPNKDNVVKINKEITDAINPTLLNQQKANADMLATSFTKQVLNDAQLTSGSSETSMQTQPQPGNYSFVGYSNDLDHKIAGNAGNPPSNLPTWNFAQRKVWTSETKTKNGSTDIVESPTSKTDVSWIYSLSGEGTKYTLEFTYYGPSTAYLYFPYKLVKSADSSLVALQYKLNGGEQQPITFAADNQQNVEATANKTPTVSDINVAKVSLSGLKFGSNTIELSVPTENPAKVAPMIGNIYITSNDQNTNKVYDDIFGNKQNTIDNKKSVMVDLLTGYSLASSWSTYIGQFTKLTDQKTMYLVGFIGGPNERVTNNITTNKVLFPYTWGNARTITIYVNVPETGQYFISGSYLTSNSRALKFSTGNSNSVTISGLKQKDWSTLGSFDTAKTTGASGQASKTLTLVKGLNKITIATGTTGGGDAPFIGNLTFTLSSAANNDDSTEA